MHPPFPDATTVGLIGIREGLRRLTPRNSRRRHVHCAQGWTLLSGTDQVLLAPPEADARLALVEVIASDAATAVASAWTTYRPRRKRPLKMVNARPGRNGWDERKVFDYETSPNERLVVQALALRKGDRWLVVIVEGAKATFEKRLAQVVLVRDSLRPKGYQRESFKGRNAIHSTPGGSRS